MSNPVSSLAPAIAGYIAAANARDSSAVTRFFAEDANVFDEGQHRVGTQAIAQWMEDTAQRFQPRRDQAGLSEHADHRGARPIDQDHLVVHVDGGAAQRRQGLGDQLPVPVERRQLAGPER